MEFWQIIDSVIEQNLAAQTALELLSANGGNIYLVNKGLREILLNREPKKLDLLVTGLTPEQVEQSLGIQNGHLNPISTGYNFRYSNHVVNIDLPRIGDTVDPRIPIEVYLGEQSHTVNALAYDLGTGQFIDPYNALSDATNGLLKPLDPNSYGSHPEHILNGIRLHGEGYIPDPQMLESTMNHGHNIKDLSPDYLRMELDQILSSNDPVKSLELMRDTGLLEYFLPEVAVTMGFDQNNQFHDLDLGSHLFEALREITSLTDDPDLRLAALLHDIGKPDSYWEDESGHGHFYQHPDYPDSGDHEEVGADMAREIMERLNYPEDRIKRVEKLIRSHMHPWWTSEKGAQRFYNFLGGDQDLANDWMKLRAADMRGKGGNPLDPIDEQNHALSFQLLQNVIDKQNASNVPNLEINGYDIMNLGIPQGEDVGRIIKELQAIVQRDPSLNNRETLLELALQYV